MNALDNPVETLAACLHAACLRDLPDIEYEHRVPPAPSLAEAKRLRPVSEWPIELRKRRPLTHDVEIVMFPQQWGSTALGYGGMGGASVTTAYTVVVSHHDTACVYFGAARLAYQCKVSHPAIRGRLQQQNMPSASEYLRIIGQPR